MTLDIEKEVDKDFDFDYEDLIEKVVNAALDYEDCPYDISLNVVITDNDGIHEINKEYRNIDRPTDVLSFPMINYDVPGSFDNLEDDPDNFDPESGELLLGDIMISVDKVYEQAESYGHSVERELGFLIAHSMLHLFGYDHMEDAEREDMEKRQRDILDSIGLVR